MGANQSDTAEAQEALTDAEIAAQGALATGVKLFSYVQEGTNGAWKQMSGSARPRFRDANEDSGKKAKDWYLEIEAGDIDARVDNKQMNYIGDSAATRVTFNVDGIIWALKFQSLAAYREFAEQLDDYAFENEYGCPNDDESRQKVFGEELGERLFTRMEGHAPMEVDNEKEVYRTPERTHNRETASDDQAATSPAKDTLVPKPRPGLSAVLDEESDEEEDVPINGILVGAGENTFLQRGSRFSVLRNQARGGMEDAHIQFTLTPSRLGGGGGGGGSTPLNARGTPSRGTPLRGSAASAPTPASTSKFTPGKMLLAQNERRMNLLEADNRNVVHHADIETQRIVSTWNFQKDGVDVPITDIATDSKSAQMEDNSTFLGLDSNRLCRWDLRTSAGVVSSSPVVDYVSGKDFARGTNFTCMATSGDGFVAVGSKDGKVRLYSNKSLTKANSAIPGLGAPITAIDVTYDGKWVLATTDSYLMVIKTTFDTDKGTPSIGLKPEDVVRTGSKPFTKAKFTWITESGQTERLIAVGAGNCTVIWNFQQIKQGTNEAMSFGGMPTNMSYSLSQAKTDDVVDSSFLHSRFADADGERTPLAVATAHTLYTVD
ncbi:MAG: hypothetical protein WDW36_009307 [Sanguina aurantia]